MALSYIIIICLVLAEAHMWILGNLDADLLQLWSSHLLFVSFGKYCIMRDTKTAVPLNGRRDGLFSETDIHEKNCRSKKILKTHSTKFSRPKN